MIDLAMKLLEDDTTSRGASVHWERELPPSQGHALALMKPSRQTVGDCACSIRLSPCDKWLSAMLVVSVNGGGGRDLLTP